MTIPQVSGPPPRSCEALLAQKGAKFLGVTDSPITPGQVKFKADGRSLQLALLQGLNPPWSPCPQMGQTGPGPEGTRLPFYHAIAPLSVS